MVTPHPDRKLLPSFILTTLGCAVLLAFGSAGCGGSDSSDAGGATEVTSQVDWSRDDRTYALLAATCGQRGHYDRDTSDMVPVLVERLADGQRDVLRHAKRELAVEGERAIGPLSEALGSWSEDVHAVVRICNGLGALRLSDADGAHDVLMRYVTHPAVDVRVAAAKGLSRHSRPADYEVLVDLLMSVEPSMSSTRDVLFAAAAHADPPRLQADLARWMQTGDARGLWGIGMAASLENIDARTAGRFRAVDATPLGPALRPQLLALQASDEDPMLLASVHHLLLEGDLPERSATLLCLASIGKREWAAEVLASDTLPAERSRAAAILGPIADQTVARDALRLGLNDADRGVRIASLTALLSVSDPLAVDRALGLLDGALGAIELASLSLRQAWEANPGLEDRAREQLVARIEEDRGDFDRIKPRLQALGLVPGRASAAYLLELADELDDRVVQGLDLHRWLARTAGNAGPDARLYLAERWSTEEDELRRMNLLEAAGGAQDEVSRRFLIDLLEGDRATEYERLVAAEWLVRLGPARVVAGLLKRVALRMEGNQTRRAIDCLLWTWYG